MATEKIVDRIVKNLNEFETLSVPEVYARLAEAVENAPSPTHGLDEVQAKVAEGTKIMKKVDEVLDAMLAAADDRFREHLDRPRMGPLQRK